MIPKRLSSKKQPENPKRYCGDCGHGIWVEEKSNLDWERKPICLTCPFRKFYILRTAIGCLKWKQK